MNEDFNFECKHCEKSFFNENILSLHTKAVHKGTKKFIVDSKNHFKCTSWNFKALGLHPRFREYDVFFVPRGFI